MKERDDAVSEEARFDWNSRSENPRSRLNSWFSIDSRIELGRLPGGGCCMVGVMGRELTKGGDDKGFRSGGARGGGASAGGSLDGTGGARIMFESASNFSTWSISSWALGTISERNSRSSEDRAIEFRALVLDGLLDLENRPKNRDTAEGVCTGSSASGVNFILSALIVPETSATAVSVADSVASASLAVLPVLASTLGRGDAILD